MSRSLHKGPFVDDHLFDRLAGMNERNEKKVIRTWSSGRISEPMKPAVAVSAVAGSLRRRTPASRTATAEVLRGPFIVFLRSTFLRPGE